MAPLSRKTPKIEVLVNGQLDVNAALLTANVSVLSGQPDTVTFTRRLLAHRRSTDLQNTQLSSFFQNDAVEVIITRSGAQSQSHIIHWGKIVALDPTINESGGEEIVYTSRLDDHLFGNPVDELFCGTRTQGSSDREGVGAYRQGIIDDPTIFNPLHEGAATPNRAADFIAGGAYHVFIDPGSVDATILHGDRKSAESGGGGQVVRFWSLADAVNYLCRTLNATEQYVKNPPHAELIAAIGDDQSIVRNHEVPMGIFLPEALDQLLVPHGYGWRVVYETGRRRIEVYERGVAPPKTLLLQKWGEKLDPDKTFLKAFSANMDFTDGSANSVRVIGGYKEREGSFLLRPGWSSQYDALGDEGLRKFNRNFQNWENDDGAQDAWRRFVFNESGHYTGTRPFWTQAPDMVPLLGVGNVLRSRRLLPALSLDSAGASMGRQQGVFLEWWDHYEEIWKPVFGGIPGRGGLSGGQFQILEEEIGIWFSDMTPPPRLMAIGLQFGIDKLFLRVTGTVRADRRLRSQKDASASFLADTKAMIVDAGRQYQDRKISHDGPADRQQPLGGTVLSAPLTAESDGLVAADDQAQTLLDKYNTANIRGVGVVEGVDWGLMDYLGRTISKIEGRELQFRSTPVGTQQTRYPTVTSLAFDIQQQVTQLRFEAVR